MLCAPSSKFIYAACLPLWRITEKEASRGFISYRPSHQPGPGDGCGERWRGEGLTAWSDGLMERGEEGALCNRCPDCLVMVLVISGDLGCGLVGWISAVLCINMHTVRRRASVQFCLSLSISFCTHTHRLFLFLCPFLPFYTLLASSLAHPFSSPLPILVYKRITDFGIYDGVSICLLSEFGSHYFYGIFALLDNVHQGKMGKAREREKKRERQRE